MKLRKYLLLLKFATTILLNLSGRWTQIRITVMMEYQFVYLNCVLLQYLNHYKFFTKIVWIMDAFLEREKDVRGVFLDLSKAIDRVWHKELMYKLKRFGICGLPAFLKMLYDSDLLELTEKFSQKNIWRHFFIIKK